MIREVEETALYRTLRALKTGEIVMYSGDENDEDIRAVAVVEE